MAPVAREITLSTKNTHGVTGPPVEVTLPVVRTADAHRRACVSRREAGTPPFLGASMTAAAREATYTGCPVVVRFCRRIRRPKEKKIRRLENTNSNRSVQRYVCSVHI